MEFYDCYDFVEMKNTTDSNTFYEIGVQIIFEHFDNFQSVKPHQKILKPNFTKVLQPFSGPKLVWSIVTLLIGNLTF